MKAAATKLLVYSGYWGIYMWGVRRVRSELCGTRMSHPKTSRRKVARCAAPKLRAVARNFEIPATPANDIMDNEERGRALRARPKNTPQ